MADPITGSRANILVDLETSLGTSKLTGTKSVSSLTSAATTATADTSTAHGWSTGDYVLIAGADQAPYNGTYQITKVDADTFTYTFAGSGTSPATGTITAKRVRRPKQITFISESLSGTQNLITNPSIRPDGNRPAPVNGNVTASGQLQVVADIDSIGWWLKLFMHQVSSAGGSDPYTHTFLWDLTSVTFQSALMQVEFVDAALYKILTGCRVKKIGLKIMSEGFFMLAIDVVAMTADDATSALFDETPTDWTTSTPIHMLHIAAADLKVDTVASTTSGGNAACLAEIEIDPTVNITENDYRIGQAGQRSGLAVGAMDLAVKFKLAVEGATQMTLMQSTSTHSIDVTFTAGVNRTLRIFIPAFTVQKTLPNVSNDMGIFVDIEGRASYDVTTTSQLKFVLVNGLSSAVHYV